jgi:Plant transposon protein
MKFKTAVLAAVMRHHDKLRLRRRALAWKPWNDVNTSEVNRKRNFAKRKFQGRPPYETSTWGLMLSNPRSQDPTDRKGGQLFRRRFRVPFPTFQKVVKMTRDEQWFSEGVDAVGIKAAPLELKILAVLRVLGRGYCFDGVEELCYISAEVLRVFFHRFCDLFSKKFFALYCCPPTTEAEIMKTTKIYSRLGLPGCIGSTDCVHIRWERCPAGERSSHKGKEGYPTLSYEVTVDHCKKIIAATQGHPGARNDKTIVKFDGFVTSINNGDLYGDVPYSLTTEDGSEIQLKGLYLIVDGGYHKWRCLQCPMKHTSKFKEGLWSKWVESVRKDVECVFGILKGRFRCLKLPIFYQTKSVIDNMFFTCCILHNILLNVDGYDIRWEKDVNWLGQSGKHHNEDMAFFKKHWRRVKNIESSTDYTLQGVSAVRDRYEIFHEGAEEIEDSHFTFRGKLVDHFIRKYTNREIEWLK